MGTSPKFTVTPLASQGYLVEGTDVNGVAGTVVLHSNPWDAVQHFKTHEVASKEFDKTVEKFFSPLIKAAEVFEAGVANLDEDAQVVFGNHVEGETTTTFDLDEAGLILNLIEQNKTDRLRWVGERLVVTAS